MLTMHILIDRLGSEKKLEGARRIWTEEDGRRVVVESRDREETWLLKIVHQSTVVAATTRRARSGPARVAESDPRDPAVGWGVGAAGSEKT